MHHNGTLDYARLLAAFGIVFFHVGTPGAGIGYAALPFFLMVLVVLAFPGAGRLSFSVYLHSRVQRLMVPWLIWSVIYAALKLAEMALTGAAFGSEFSANMMLMGTALHLWFLPFAFATCLAIYPLAQIATRVGPESLALVMAGSGLSILLLRQGVILPAPFAQWLYALPAVCIGIALALVWERLPMMLLILGGFISAALLSGAPMGLLQIVLASSALILCMLFPLPASPLARQAGALALGVYLAHPLILSLLGRATTLPHDSVAMALLGCLGGLSIAYGLHMIPQMPRHFAGGSPAGKVQNTIL